MQKLQDKIHLKIMRFVLDGFFYFWSVSIVFWSMFILEPVANHVNQEGRAECCWTQNHENPNPYRRDECFEYKRMPHPKPYDTAGRPQHGADEDLAYGVELLGYPQPRLQMETPQIEPFVRCLVDTLERNVESIYCLSSILHRRRGTKEMTRLTVRS